MDFGYSNLLKEIENTIKSHNLVSEKDKILVALSGGSDSVFLLRVLNDLKQRLGFSLFAAHLNHSLRAEADTEEAFVIDLCKSLDIPCYTKKVHVKTISQRTGESLETVGRCERYSFFNELKKLHGFNKIATAHHLDDNAETILMHFIRGCGGNGLRGIEYMRHDGIIRPLLDVPKKSIVECCEACGFSYVTDMSNFEPDFTRNRVRLELIPEILKFNPNFCNVITKNSMLFSEDEEFLDDFAETEFNQNYIDGGLLKSVVDKSPMAIKRRLIQKLYQSFQNSKENLSLGYIDAILALTKTGQSVSLPNNLEAILSYGKFIVRKKTKTEDFEYDIVPDIPLYIPESNCHWLIKRAEKCDRNTFSLPYGGTLRVRNKRRGDYFYPVGMKGKKKLSDLFCDKKIPRFMRDSIPILTINEDIININGDFRDRRFYDGITKDNLFSLVIYKEN